MNAAYLASVAATELRGHEAAAVRLLDSLADHHVPLSTDSEHVVFDHVLRGEIYCQAGRWVAADSDLRPLVDRDFAELLHDPAFLGVTSRR